MVKSSPMSLFFFLWSRPVLLLLRTLSNLPFGVTRKHKSGKKEQKRKGEKVILFFRFGLPFFWFIDDFFCVCGLKKGRTLKDSREFLMYFAPSRPP
jgi:hypothetical protein